MPPSKFKIQNSTLRLRSGQEFKTDETNRKPSIMDALMASYENKKLKFERGEKITGEIINITDSEIILDLQAKAEGVLSKRELSAEKLSSLKIGETLEVYIVSSENESGQIILSLYKQENINFRSRTGRKIDFAKWQKFIQGKETQAKFTGEISEINKGGLIVSLDTVPAARLPARQGRQDIRGFVPSSQVSLKSLGSPSDLIGQNLKLTVLEVDPNNNKLVFSARPALTDKEKEELLKFKAGDTVKGKIQAVLPFGLFVRVGGTEAIIFPQEISWTVNKGRSQENTDELVKNFKQGEEIEAKIMSIDEMTGRLNLSLRQMEKDPFEEIAQNFQADDVITGLITNITQDGIDVALEGSNLGFISAEKMEGQGYQIGQKYNFLVDSLNFKNRKINLAPFLTTTKGLIYK